MTEVEGQRDEIKGEYINMLIMGAPGGMTDEEARKFVNEKFQILSIIDYKQKDSKEQRQRSKENIHNLKKKFRPIIIDGEYVHKSPDKVS